MYKKVLGVLGVGRDEREEKSCTGSSDSESSWHSAEPGTDVLEDFHDPTTESNCEMDSCATQRESFHYYGPNESDSAASTSSWHPRRNSRVKRSSRRSKDCLNEVVSQSRQLTLDNEVLNPEERSEGEVSQLELSILRLEVHFLSFFGCAL